MPIALAVVAVLAAVFLVLFLMTKSSAAEFRTQADARETALVTERDGLKETTNRQAGELTDAHDEIAELRGEAKEAASQLQEREEQLAEAKSLAGEQADKIETQSTEIDTLQATNGELEARAAAAEAEAAAAAARNIGIVVGDAIDVGSPQPETLWALELTRSQRTWRTSVAPNPDADIDPFEGSDDLVRKAIEIEAAALRENVGAFITLDWQAGQVTDPARKHLVVRVAQELLEAAARGPEPSRLVVTSDDDDVITLRLEGVNDAEEPVPVIPPRITSELVDIRDAW
jgi:hypothetical protein